MQLRTCWALALLLVPAHLPCESLARFEGENLAGKKVALPDAAAGRVAILIAGFSHASQRQTRPWDETLEREFTEPAKAVVYPIAVLEGIPRFVRGMAVHGIKSGTPKPEWGRFLLVYQGAETLKREAGFAGPDDAYILVIDPTGAIRWRFHGPETEAALAQVRQQVQSAAAGAK
jgi:ATP10 protein